MAFYVGQRVECIHDYSAHKQVWPECSFPVLGAVYVIRRVGVTDMGEGLWLREIINPEWSTRKAEPGFYVRSFRPVVERKTDISVFVEMLKPSRVSA